MDWIQINRCNLPPWAVASHHFDEHPRPLELAGVAHANAALFRLLDGLDDPDARGRAFDDWMSVRFQLHHWQDQATPGARRSLRNSYLRFLRGWGMDASSVEGAVLKGWVESRIGIPPRFHHAPLVERAGEAWARYEAEKTRGHAFTSAIDAQLDLVYAFTQYELRRRAPGVERVTLWRGQDAPGPDEIVDALGPREWIVRTNNVLSFTDDRERAWEVGSCVLEVTVAVARVFFAGHLLPRSVLRGEREHLLIGGALRARRVLG